jgi:hypothetical protein
MIYSVRISTLYISVGRRRHLFCLQGPSDVGSKQNKGATHSEISDVPVAEEGMSKETRVAGRRGVTSQSSKRRLFYRHSTEAMIFR